MMETIGSSEKSVLRRVAYRNISEYGILHMPQYMPHTLEHISLRTWFSFKQ
jgi:hypothetical protein